MRHLRLLIGTLVAASFLAVQPESPGLAGPGFDPPGLGRAIKAQERHTQGLLTVQGVVGTGVGRTTTGKPAVKIFTERAGISGLPRTLDGVPVVVQVTGKLFALHHACGHTGGPPGHLDAPCPPPGDPPPGDPPPEDPPDDTDPKAKLRPAPIGVSTSNIMECAAGTIGARVTDDGDKVYALSNNHVYARENQGVIGDPDDPEDLGDAVVQPGRFDVNCAVNVDDPDDVIGTLTAFVEIDFDPSAINEVDAAIAEILNNNDPELLDNATPSDGYGTPKSAIFIVPEDALPLAVQKYGRTTSLTKGNVTAIHGIVLINYDSGLAQFVDQIIVESKKPFLKPGDSGALVVVDGGGNDLEPVGLAFASNPNGKFVIVNPIDEVLDQLSTACDCGPLAIDGD